MPEHVKAILFFLGFVLFSIGLGAAIAMIPDRWERAGWDEAILIKICPGNIPIVRLPDGTMWVRISWSVRYRVEDESKVCP